ncbi:UNVERIFIED_CONTAM: hypothetical protein Q9R58_00925 [Methylobacteriaceae bacterium AG10]|nr:hypothetical protein [Methylobacteriaceae bacterium AG10]
MDRQFVLGISRERTRYMTFAEKRDSKQRHGPSSGKMPRNSRPSGDQSHVREGPADMIQNDLVVRLDLA